MSNISDSKSEIFHCKENCAHVAVLDHYPAKEAMLGGGLKIRRALPTMGKRMVGPWCFMDHFGPKPFDKSEKVVDVGSHPHIGLQTVTWIINGEILHKDSLGYEQLIRPGQLNVMTAGKGIVHSEETPVENVGEIHGVQLWIALPDVNRKADPAFEHIPELPIIENNGLRVHLFMGSAYGQTSPATVFSPIVGMEVQAQAGVHQLELSADFEHAIMMVEGSMRASEQAIEIGGMYDLGKGRTRLEFQCVGHVRFMVIGGAPFGEEILMWWNLVAREQSEIKEALDHWNTGTYFDTVPAYKGERLKAPELVLGLKKR
jgi:redox-sensitive bicupin YhaK (pirin superfamily)